MAKPPAKIPPCPSPEVLSPFRQWADNPAGLAMHELCDYIVSNGVAGHLAGFARSKGFAYGTVMDWIRTDTERTAMYARAREDRADVLADEIVDISDEEVTMIKADKHGGKGDEDGLIEVAFDATAVARNKLRVDARKWAASKLKPRVYGEKVQIAGDPDNPLLIGPAAMTDAQLAAIAAGKKA